MAKNIFDDIKHAAKKAGEAVKKGAEDAAKGAKDVGGDVIHGNMDKAGHDAQHDASSAATHARHSADAIGKDLEHALMTTLNDVTHLGETIKKDIEHLAGDIKRDVQHLADQAKGEVTHIEQTAAAALKKAAEDVEGEAKHAIDEALSAVRTEAVKARDALQEFADDEKKGWQKLGTDIKNDIESAAHSEITKLTEQAIQKGLQEADKAVKALKSGIDKLEAKAPSMVDLLNNVGDDINLGPVKLRYQNFISRAQHIADALDKVLGEDFKLTQTFLDDLLHGLGPDTVSIDADVEFFTTIGIDLNDLPFQAFIEIADIVFNALGVPK